MKIHRDVIKLRRVPNRCSLCGRSTAPGRIVCQMCPAPTLGVVLKDDAKPGWQKELRTRMAFARSMMENPPKHSHRVSIGSRRREIYQKVWRK